MNPAILILLTTLAAIGPLTDEQRLRLETARDGGDHREEAFMALIENAGEWSEGPIEEPVRLNPDFETMLGSTEEYRGELCRIAGVIQQQSGLGRPYDEAREWFVRDATGRPILVFVAGLADEEAGDFVDGRRVAIYARFYKRVDAVAQDGRLRSYPAFVGALPSLATGMGSKAGSSGTMLRAVIVLLSAVGAVFVIVLVMSRRVQSRRKVLAPLPGRFELRDSVEGEPLPDDPVKALAELKSRAERGRVD